MAPPATSCHLLTPPDTSCPPGTPQLTRRNTWTTRRRRVTATSLRGIACCAVVSRQSAVGTCPRLIHGLERWRTHVTPRTQGTLPEPAPRSQHPLVRQLSNSHSQKLPSPSPSPLSPPLAALLLPPHPPRTSAPNRPPTLRSPSSPKHSHATHVGSRRFPSDPAPPGGSRPPHHRPLSPPASTPSPSCSAGAGAPTVPLTRDP
jgi:hypothetical protein